MLRDAAKRKNNRFPRVKQPKKPDWISKLKAAMHIFVKNTGRYIRRKQKTTGRYVNWAGIERFIDAKILYLNIPTVLDEPEKGTF